MIIFLLSIVFLSIYCLVTITTSTSQHTDCTEVNLGGVRLNSQRKDAVLSAKTSWNVSTSERLCLGQPRGMLFSEVGKRRDILDLYSTTIKQLQGPQLRSYMLLLSHVPLLLSFILLALPQPHVLTHRSLCISSHTSVLPLHTKQLGSS